MKDTRCTYKYTYMYNIDGHIYYGNNEDRKAIKENCQDRWADAYYALQERISKEKDVMKRYSDNNWEERCSYKRSKQIVETAQIIRICFRYSYVRDKQIVNIYKGV